MKNCFKWHLFKLLILCNFIHVFTLTFDQSLLNKSINLFSHLHYYFIFMPKLHMKMKLGGTKATANHITNQ